MLKKKNTDAANKLQRRKNMPSLPAQRHKRATLSGLRVSEKKYKNLNKIIQN